MTTLSTCELVVDNTVDSKDTKEEKTREVPRHNHFICITSVEICLNLDVICFGDGGWHQSFFIFLAFVTTLRWCEFEVDDTDRKGGEVNAYGQPDRKIFGFFYNSRQRGVGDEGWIMARGFDANGKGKGVLEVHILYSTRCV